MASPSLFFGLGVFGALLAAALVAVIAFGQTEVVGPAGAILLNALFALLIAAAGSAGYSMARPRPRNSTSLRELALGFLVGGPCAAWVWLSPPSQLGLAGYAGAVLVVSFALGHVLRRIAT